jgi:hypothetical protein
MGKREISAAATIAPTVKMLRWLSRFAAKEVATRAGRRSAGADLNSSIKSPPLARVSTKKALLRTYEPAYVHRGGPAC